MKEDFLHYIWQNKLFLDKELFSVSKQKIEIISVGMTNTNSGPDFLDAKIKIEDIIWGGNVEIHKKSSDWYVHGHEKDPAYDNVILHVVFDDDIPVYNSNNQQIPTLNISKYVDKKLLKKFNKLIKNKSILRCQNQITKVEPYIIIHYKYKLFFERLEHKNKIVDNLLYKSSNNWEQVLYETLLKYFGGTVNKEAFRQLAGYLPYEIFKKYRNNPFQLEALLFGIGGMLFDDKAGNEYYNKLRNEYEFLSKKHGLFSLKSGVIRFHRLRPQGFPTLRLAQFAMLYHNVEFLFDYLMKLECPNDAYELLEVTAGEFWDTHYNFDKTTKKRKKTFGRSFIDRILINVVVPLKFSYQKYKGEYNPDEIINFIEQIKPEKNRIVDIFHKVKLHSKNALDTQAIIQLSENYCKKDKCLACDIGHEILKNDIKDE